MFDFEMKSKEHHYRGDDGLPLCGAPLQGLVTLWEDESMVTCEKCLEKLDEQRRKT